MTNGASGKENGSQYYAYFPSTLPFVVTALLAVAGTLAATFLTYRHILLTSNAGQVAESVLCRSTGKMSCDAVLLTQYSVLFDFIPSSVLGLMGFTLMLWLAANGLLNPRVRKEALSWLLIYLSVAISFSAYYVYIMLFDVDFICTWCVVVHVINLCSFIFVLAIFFRYRTQLEKPSLSNTGEHLYLLIGGLTASLAVFFFAGYLEKSIAYEEIKRKHNAMGSNPLVMAAILKASPEYDIGIDEKDPVYGNPLAPYAIVLFSDFQCPVCMRAELFLISVVDSHPEKLKLVFKNYPLSSKCNPRVPTNVHPKACQAAQAAYSAFLLGGARGFWIYAFLLFAHQSELDADPWLALADKARLDQQTFSELMQADSPSAEKIRDDVSLGIRLGLDATPEIFFQNKKLPENWQSDNFVPALEEFLRISTLGQFTR